MEIFVQEQDAIIQLRDAIYCITLPVWTISDAFGEGTVSPFSLVFVSELFVSPFSGFCLAGHARLLTCGS